MSSRQIDLDETQRWLLAAITDADADEPAGLNEIVKPSNQQSAVERLAIYRHAYLARLLDVLRELFPCTRFAVGDELFDQFTVGYLQAHPPASDTLAHLADKLADHLDATRPADWGHFIVELARLEQGIDRIFDAPGPEALPPFDIPKNASGALRLSLVPGFELYAFKYPVSRFYSDWKAGVSPVWPATELQHLALFRRDYVVRRFELTPTQYKLLTEVARGSVLGEALIVAAEAELRPVDELAGQFRGWFTQWAKSGFFAAAV